jgi:hypothetical protein
MQRSTGTTTRTGGSSSRGGSASTRAASGRTGPRRAAATGTPHGDLEADLRRRRARRLRGEACVLRDIAQEEEEGRRGGGGEEDSGKTHWTMYEYESLTSMAQYQANRKGNVSRLRLYLQQLFVSSPVETVTSSASCWFTLLYSCTYIVLGTEFLFSSREDDTRS